MPELPEVEILVRHLTPLLKGQTVRAINVRRRRVLRPTSGRAFRAFVLGATFTTIDRRGKYLLFDMRRDDTGSTFLLVGHLGMTGRMYLQPRGEPLPKHAAVVMSLGRMNFVFEDLRYFGRLTLDTRSIQTLGPEPLDAEFTIEAFQESLERSAQAIKVKLLDQSVVAGVGNIYASEALFRARISPRLAARRMRRAQVERLWAAIREVLSKAIELGSTVPLAWSTRAATDGLVYFGRGEGTPDSYDEQLRVYDREGRPCVACGGRIKRIVQAARSTFYCPSCQRE